MKSFALFLFLCCLLHAPSIASDQEEEFPELTWAHVVKGSVECVGNLFEVESQENGAAPTLEFTGLEHDLPAIKRPAFLHFKTPNCAYKLCDSDGGATIAFLYAACMSDLHKKMFGMTGSARKKVKSESIPIFPIIKSLFKHSLNRLASRLNELGLATEAMPLVKIMNELDTEDVSYRMLFNLVGAWLRNSYVKLFMYPIEVTHPLLEGEAGSKGQILVRGIQQRKPKTLGWSPVGNTLHHFCVKNLETKLAYGFGVYELSCDNLEQLILAYNVKRAIDQGLHSDYHVVRTTVIDPVDGLPMIIEKMVPVAENPKVAVLRDETSKNQKRMANKAKNKK